MDERALRVVQAADEKKTPDFEVSRMQRIDAVAVPLERCARSLDCSCSTTEVARYERDLGLGDDAPSTSHDFFLAEPACGTAQQGLGTDEIAQLRHRDPAKRERRRIVA
jgi:hypothetical protein